MCGLAYIKRPFDGMTDWLEAMQKVRGGDGNGVAVAGTLTKGVQVTIEDTVGAIHAAQPARQKDKRDKRVLRPALWHTRRTSSGGDCDILCHPHPCAGGWLVHNGHWSTMAAQAMNAKWREPMSDSRLFSLIVASNEFKAAVDEWQPPGVWLHMRADGKLAVWLGSGDLWYCPRLGAWGSMPADVGGHWVQVSRGWRDYGERPRKPASIVKYNGRRDLVTTTVVRTPDSRARPFSQLFPWWRA